MYFLCPQMVEGVGEMKYCCKKFKEQQEQYTSFYFDDKNKMWNIQEYDEEWNRWFDVMEDVNFCPFCGKRLET